MNKRSKNPTEQDNFDLTFGNEMYQKGIQQGKQLFADKVLKIIEIWYFGLGYTQGIVVNLQKVVTDYNITELKQEIGRLLND